MRDGFHHETRVRRTLMGIRSHGHGQGLSIMSATGVGYRMLASRSGSSLPLSREHDRPDMSRSTIKTSAGVLRTSTPRLRIPVYLFRSRILIFFPFFVMPPYVAVFAILAR
jgi:hypothetical protein